jgi:osmotically inducible protein OsmC
MKRTGSAVWKGGLKDGTGTLSTESGVLKDQSYSFAKRFGDEAGTNPEELIAAAHAACFSMQLSGVLGQSGLTADEITTSAAITGEMDGGGFTIKTSHLTVTARVPGADEAAFLKAAETAKSICPVSKVLNAAITMDAKLQR